MHLIKILTSSGPKLAALTAAFLTTACASAPSTPIAPPCVQTPTPIVHRCQPPTAPARLDTQTDLLLAYMDALSAWKICAIEIDRLIKFYEELGK